MSKVLFNWRAVNSSSLVFREAQKMTGCQKKEPMSPVKDNVLTSWTSAHACMFHSVLSARWSEAFKHTVYVPVFPVVWNKETVSLCSPEFSNMPPLLYSYLPSALQARHILRWHAFKNCGKRSCVCAEMHNTQAEECGIQTAGFSGTLTAQVSSVTLAVNGQTLSFCIEEPLNHVSSSGVSNSRLRGPLSCRF